MEIPVCKGYFFYAGEAMQGTPAAESILVIGCGYLGKRLGALLVAEGARVTATTTSPERLEELRDAGLEPALLDLAGPAESEVWRQRYDGGVVYAVAPGRGGDARLAFHDGPLDCARRLMAASPLFPRRFVLVSSTGVYGESDGGWVDEETPAEPTDERLRWLVAAEAELRRLAAAEGFPAVIVRLGGIYGHGRSPAGWLLRPEMRERMTKGRGDAFMNWVRVEDAARATALALRRGRPGEIYVIADGEPVRRADFYGLAARRAGIELPPFAAEGGTSTGGRTDGEPGAARRTAGDLGKRVRIDKARRELGFTPRYPSYREGLADL